MRRLMGNRFLILPTLTDADFTSWFVFVVRLNDEFGPGDRDLIMQALREEGIGCNNYFPPIHVQPYVREKLRTKAGDYPVCEYVADRTIALPFFTRMTAQQVERVCQTLEELLHRFGGTAPRGRIDTTAA